MILTTSTAVLAALPGAPSLTILAETGSTNDDLRALAVGAPAFTAVVTGSQTGGRGRLGRPWIAPAGEALAISVLLRPVDAAGEPLGLDTVGWFPIIAGMAMTAAVRSQLPDSEVALKWPNDVLIGPASGGRKVCGILTELLPGETQDAGRALSASPALSAGPALIVGAGLNLAIPADRLPTRASTSLRIEGARATGDDLADAACAAYLTELERLCGAFARAGGDAAASGIRALALDCLGTIGRRVRVTVPAGAPIVGTAVDLDDAGRIVVRPDGESGLQAVAAGDVEHLRYE